MHATIPPRLNRRGNTLIDVAVGAALLAILLIPAIKLMGQSSRLVADLDINDALLLEAESLLERTKIELCDPAVFAVRRDMVEVPPTTTTLTNVHARARISNDDVPPALIGRLATIQTIAWRDLDGDGQPSTGEPQQSLRTQWCRP